MVQIRQLAADDPELGAWRRSIRDAHLAGRESSWWESLESLQVYLGRASVHNDRRAVAAFDGGRCVGGAEITLPLRYDTETLSVELGVVPDLRGRGVGAELLERVKAVATQRDRSILQTELHIPAGQELEDTVGGRFALSRGMSSVSTEDRFLLDLPLDEARVADLRAGGDGYELHSFVDRVPDEYVAEWARMVTHMNEDVPMGELTHTPQPINVDRIREAERTFAEQGWTRLRSLALTPDGLGAGYTEMFVSRYDAEFVIQDDTFVDRAHRGHRLGARLKLANLRNLADLAERTGGRWSRVQTYTEQHNTAMQHTNEAFGFRRVDVLHELEGHVGGLG
ncbi:GNAT family N-acetyltransferase [Flexivirga alba]|uniref:GNAT family N-acetyltransferase n=1 Tax=Flexivirga alba TaxID=702742 RepID=A0ABW2AHD2_9MICO